MAQVPQRFFDALAVRTWCGLSLRALGHAREEIDAINVYPVADGDTGTNLYLTVESAVAAVEAVFAAHEVSGEAVGAMSADAISALYLYTCESGFYREINAVLRSSDRERVVPYLSYLRLLFSAMEALPAQTRPLWRGVALDLRSQYPLGRTVTWWGVSSCTSEPGVARAFLGRRGRRTLFEVTPARAVGIRQFSAFTGEEEYILAPGTQLKVTEVKAERGGLCTVRLTELEGAGLVS
ncbi:ADP-ribosyltransferase domain-containing protein [Streptomyces tendae]